MCLRECGSAVRLGATTPPRECTEGTWDRGAQGYAGSQTMHGLQDGGQKENR